MEERIMRPGRCLRVAVRCLLLVLLGMASLCAPALAVDCKIACKGPDLCEMDRAPSGAERVGMKPAVYRSCENLVAKGPVELRYMHGQSWFAPPMLVQGPLSKVFEAYPADAPCSVPTHDCIQSHMNRMTTAFGGSPIDNRVAAPGGTGEPCKIGFPCGRILIPPSDWRFRIGDQAAAGRWIVKLARGTVAPGQPEQLVASVASGLVAADGNWFAPGSKCSYTFVDPSGRVVATGEFTVVSRATQEKLREQARGRVAAGSSEAVAWSDTLAANEYEWDAVQDTRIAGGAP